MADIDPQITGGAARCPGTSWDDLMAQDSRPAPAILTEESYAYLGSEPLDASRYTSEEFAKLEREKMWPYVWQFAAREEVREIGVFDQAPVQVHEFAWGFVVEQQSAWNVYVAEVWRQGTVGYFDRFLSAWKLEATSPLDDAGAAPDVPAGLLVDDGISSFSSLSFELEPGSSLPQVRRWLGETFIGRMLPRMAARVLDDSHDFPASDLAN